MRVVALFMRFTRFVERVSTGSITAKSVTALVGAVVVVVLVAVIALFGAVDDSVEVTLAFNSLEAITLVASRGLVTIAVLNTR